MSFRELAESGTEKKKSCGSKTDHSKKLADVAGMIKKRAALSDCSRARLLILWYGYGRGEMLAEPLPVPEGGEMCFSLNSALNYYLLRILKRENFVINESRLDIKEINTREDKIAAEFLKRLNQSRRLQVFIFGDEFGGENEPAGKEDLKMRARENFQPERDFIGVGPIGYPSDYCEKHDLPVVFNASFFLFESEDHKNPYSLLGEHYNLWLHEEKIKSPPLYNRTAFMRSRAGFWQLKRLSLQDMGIDLAGKSFALDKFFLNPADPDADYVLYNRCFGVERFGHTIKYTPEKPGSFHYIIVGDRVLGCAEGGGAPIPQNGFVLALPREEIKPAGAFGERLDYHFLSGEKYTEGIQNGPALLKEGKNLVEKDILSEEEFFPSHISCRKDDCGVVPTDFAYDVDKTRAARLMLGITRKNELGIIAVEGQSLAVESAGNGMSDGATLAEMAGLAQERNYRCALNLDGGGSTNLLFDCQPLIERAAVMGSDRRGNGGERMVPVVGVIE